MKKYDVIIIGSGVAGMTAGIYLKRSGINVLIIEGSAPGGQLNKALLVKNYPGIKEIDGPELAYNIYEQLNELKVDYLYEEVIKTNLEKKIITTKNNQIEGKFIIIATGRIPRKLNLENEEKLIGKGISYCALCDGNLYKDKEVIVVGGGNSALEEAIYLSKICKKVTLIHRRNTFKAELRTVEELNSIKKINIIKNQNIIKYNIKDNKLASVIISKNKEIKADGLFISIGYEPNTNIFQLEKEDNYIIVDQNYETSLKDVYAIGDVIKKEVYQITTSASDGIIAANNIIKKINQENL